MSEIPLNPSIEQVVEEMYAECRQNVDAYDSPIGIELEVGGVGWAVTYWPPSSTSVESLSLTRDWPSLIRPVVYGISKEGQVTKNEKIVKRAPGGVEFDEAGEAVVTDMNEVFTLQAILKAAHHLKRQ